MCFQPPDQFLARSFADQTLHLRVGYVVEGPHGRLRGTPIKRIIRVLPSRHFPYRLSLKTIQARNGRHSDIAAPAMSSACRFFHFLPATPILGLPPPESWLPTGFSGMGRSSSADSPPWGELLRLHNSPTRVSAERLACSSTDIGRAIVQPQSLPVSAPKRSLMKRVLFGEGRARRSQPGYS